MVTNSLFLWCTALTCAILLGFLIPILIELINIKGETKLEISHVRNDIKPITSFVNDTDKFFRERGLTNSLDRFITPEPPKHHSLPPDKTLERDTLTKLRQTRELTEVETNRLKTLLQEDANDELAKGVIGIFAFLAIVAIINAITSNSGS
jgi:hypothetical protein